MWSWLRQTASRVRAAWRSDASTLLVGFSIATALLLVLAVLQAVELRLTQPLVVWGGVADAFAAAATLLAVGVALWQANQTKKHAAADSREANRRFRRELEGAQERHDAEMAYQRESQRRLALVRVSRAVNAYSNELFDVSLLGVTYHGHSYEQRRAIAKKVHLLGVELIAEIDGARSMIRQASLREALNDLETTTAPQWTVDKLDQGPRNPGIALKHQSDQMVDALKRLRSLALDATDW